MRSSAQGGGEKTVDQKRKSGLPGKNHVLNYTKRGEVKYSLNAAEEGRTSRKR